MTAFALVTEGAPDARPDEVILRLDGGNGSKIEWSSEFFDGWRPTLEASDLLALAMAVSTVDKVAPRRASDDGWTRTLAVRAPMSSAHDLACVTETLSFLTGDAWAVTGYPVEDPALALPPLDQALLPSIDADAVSLFSGGLDSLCGVITLLEDDPKLRLLLVSHYEGGQASPRQRSLYDELVAHYGADRVILRRLWVRPAPRSAGGGLDVVERTTRARSFLFLAAAIAAASGLGADTPVYVPENGYIALNVPLTRARVGSASTRTTHPYYFELLGRCMRQMNMLHEIRNPLGLMTKGEALANCPNQALLSRLAPQTISCSHPEVGRWGALAQGNCGYCFPCIIRQASLHASGMDGGAYVWNVMGDGSFLDESQSRGADLRAVLNAIYAERPDREIFRNGPLPAHRREYLRVWREGNAEIRRWLEEGASGMLSAKIRSLS